MAETERGIQRYEPPGQIETIQGLEESFAVAVRQRELLADYIKKRMLSGKHFYKVAEGQKPSLTKEGAELICLPHGLKPAYFKEAGPEQPLDDDTPYQITVKCRLMKGETFGGEGIGSASSHTTKKDGTRIVRMRDIGLRHNSTLKMAQKSAYIAATLNATAASEFFTQDMEDSEADETKRADGQKDAPIGLCRLHQKPFRQGRGGDWYCPTKLLDGTWCKERPKIVEGQAVEAPKMDKAVDTPQFPPSVPEIPSKPKIGASPNLATLPQRNFLKTLTDSKGISLAVIEKYLGHGVDEMTVAEANDIIKGLQTGEIKG